MLPKHNMQFKLLPPSSSGNWIKRERLISYISEASEHRAIFVMAPAGFGKTIFLTQWYAQRCEDIECVWLTLDKSDSNRIEFLRSLLMAIRSVKENIGSYTEQLLDARGEPKLDEIINFLIGDFSELESDTLIIIDDYDWADTPGINEIVETLIRYTPPYIQFLIASRKQPGLPIARLKVQDNCSVITIDELRFSVAEGISFFNKIHCLDVTDSQVSDIIEKSEGWIAGLQLVMLSIKNDESNKTLLDSSLGEFRDVADYLAGDVLAQQPKELQEFLIKTSVLNKLNVDLCNLLTGRKDSQEILIRLESANLFLTPVGETRKWYRYHQLFREFLQSELYKSRDISKKDLCQRASCWYEQHDMPEEAIEESLQAEDNIRSVLLVEKFAEQMIRRGQVRPIISWMNKISPELEFFKERIRFSMIQVWVLFHLGRAKQGAQVLQQTIAKVNEEKLERNEKFNAECLALNALLASSGEDFETVKLMVENPQPYPDAFPFFAGTYACALAGGSFQLGLLDETIEFANIGYERLAVERTTYGIVFVESILGLVAISRGELRNALQHFERGEQVALADTDASSYCCGLSRALKGVVFYLQYKVDDARRLLIQSLPLISGCGYVEFWRSANLVRARLLSADKLWIKAEELLKGYLYEQSYEWEKHSTPIVIDERIRMYLLEGDVEAAEREAVQFGSSVMITEDMPTKWSRSACLPLRAKARLSLALQQPQVALDIAQNLIVLAQRSGEIIRVLEMSILEALAYRALGFKVEAFESLMVAVGLAQKDIIIAPFIEEGEQCAKLIDEVIKENFDSKGMAFLKEIVKYFSKRGVGSKNIGLKSERQFGLYLTGREHDVLEFLAEGVANKDISQELLISEHTVKWHVRNILEKFGVSSRMKAVLAAKEEGFL